MDVVTPPRMHDYENGDEEMRRG
ncbi:uncharacterized protein G2W53_017826 [Senna tora]|uniref:Uncharacterized protein n=1 Tax=Senna tora TaxID=362788 RepID=A0A834TSN2_9FABA|nr:uncharacterized protein G2W53_017826 [Senna tora]